MLVVLATWIAVYGINHSSTLHVTLRLNLRPVLHCHLLQQWKTCECLGEFVYDVDSCQGNGKSFRAASCYEQSPGFGLTHKPSELTSSSNYPACYRVWPEHEEFMRTSLPCSWDREHLYITRELTCHGLTKNPITGVCCKDWICCMYSVCIWNRLECGAAYTNMSSQTFLPIIGDTMVGGLSYQELVLVWRSKFGGLQLCISYNMLLYTCAVHQDGITHG